MSNIQLRSAELVWIPMSVNGWTRDMLDKATRNLEIQLEEWDGCRYESGQSFNEGEPGAADCIGSVFGVVDWTDGKDRRYAPGFPSDTAMHNRNTAVLAMRELQRRYAPNTKIKATAEGVYYVQPGDIIVTGLAGGGPGHVAMVGPKRNTMWESVPSTGFRQQGWVFFAGQEVWAVYRLDNKEDWLGN